MIYLSQSFYEINRLNWRNIMKHKTALGRPIDMTALIAKNEKVRAVGNMGVNARGDQIDNSGRVVVPNTERVNKNYSNSVGNRSAQSQPKKQNPNRTQPSQASQTRRIQPIETTIAPVSVSEPLDQTMEEVLEPVDVIKEQLTEYEKELQEDIEDEIEVEELKKNYTEKFKKNG